MEIPENHDIMGLNARGRFLVKAQNCVIEGSSQASLPQALNSQGAQISQVQPWLEAQHESEILVPSRFWFSFQIYFQIRVSSFRIPPF